MAAASATPFSALLKKPSTKAKPISLRGNSIDRSDQNYLNENLLEEDEPFESPPTYQTPERSQSLYGDRFGDSHRLVIAVDLGTTFTGVAFATPDSSVASLEDIEVVKDWGRRIKNSDKVPTVYSYSPASSTGDQAEEQWASDLSENAVAMVNSKLELECGDNKSDELELLLQVLDGMKNLDFQHVKKHGGSPDYTWKCAEDIVCDFLTKVYKYFNQYLDKAVEEFGPQLRATFPVDIIITVPVVWSYRAKNSTFKAVRNAGFNEDNFPNLRDIIMVTEPEAAAIYTARQLKKDLGREFLQVRECFVLCDAGGGTVDCVSYRVKELEPTLELERVGFPTSAKCGSVNIDASFKMWLRLLIGERNYRLLDPKDTNRRVSGNTTEGKLMRKIMREFDGFKKAFGMNRRNFRMQLPSEFDHVNVRGKIEDGFLAITYEEMKSFFDPWVDQIVELVKGQIKQVEKERRRVKQIFLVGGFSESSYLQNEIRVSMGLRKIQMHRPETSWTAVVRGAVLYGIEKNDHPRVTTTSTCPKNYGIVLDEVFSGARNDGTDMYTNNLTRRAMARKQMTWPVQKGDLLLSDEPKMAEKECQFSFRETDSRKFLFPIYEYSDVDVPRRFQNAEDELTQVLVLSCDLSRYEVDEFDRYQNNGNPYYVAALVCRMVLTRSSLTVEIVWNDQVVCSAKKDTELSTSWKNHHDHSFRHAEYQDHNPFRRQSQCNPFRVSSQARERSFEPRDESTNGARQSYFAAANGFVQRAELP